MTGAARRWARLGGRILAKAAATLALLTLITFLASNALPGDVARVALGRGATPQQLAQFRTDQGLDRPVLERYVDWLGRAVRGDWGTSLTSRQRVSEELGPRLQRTGLLILAACLIGVPVALAGGLWAGQRTSGLADVASSTAVLVVGALPEFVVGFLVLVTFAVGLGWFPVDSTGIAFDLPPADIAAAYVLPVLTLVLVIVPYVLRMMRVSVRETAEQPYVRAAVLRGLKPRRVSVGHIFPNAVAPVVNVLALTLAELLSVVVVVEAVFGFPGAGQLLVASVTSGDLPTVQALTLVIGATFILLNSLADLALIAVTPKLRTG